MKSILVLLTIILGVTGCSKNEPQVKPIEKEYSFDKSGVWKGIARQYSNNSSWPVQIDIKSGKNSIDYPSLKCGGDLILIKTTSNQIEFREKITYGKSKCVDNGIAVLRFSSNYTADFVWYYENGEQGAFGKMSKREK